MRYLFLLLLFCSTCLSQAQVIKRAPGTSPQAGGNRPPFGEDSDTIGILGEPQDSTRALIEQNTDTINFVQIIREYDLNLTRKAVTISIDDVHQYQEAMQTKEPSINYGNNGMPIRKLTYEPEYYHGIDLGRHSLNRYKIHNDSVKYYQAERPFTKLFYAAGSARENRFMLTHTQNWGRGINVGFDYQRLVSDGFYLNQIIDHNNIAVHSWFRSKNKKLNVLAHHISNKYSLGANGGIEPGVNYFNLEDFENRLNIPVSLPEAEKFYKAKHYQLQSSYDFGESVQVPINDSISDIQLVPQFRVQHTIRYSKAQDRFRNSAVDNSFFDQVYTSANEVNDSIEQNTLFTEFRIKWLGNKLGQDSILMKQNFLADAYLNYSNVSIDMKAMPFILPPQSPVSIGRSATINDVVAGGSFRSNDSDSVKILYKAEGEFHLTDYRQGDFTIKGEAGFNLNKAGRLIGMVQLINQEQFYAANEFGQTHYQFSNNLSKLNARVIGGEYYNPVLKTTLKTRLINASNVLYYNEDRNPVTSPDAETYFMLQAHKQANYKSFYANASILYQQSSNSIAIGRPELLANGDIFFKGPLFKNKVIGKIGFNAQYMSAFYLDNYDPSLDQFFVQREFEYENNPQLGFFTNFQLSRARVFARFDNLSSFFFDQPIMQGHNYPQHEFAFRTGINWVFVN